MASSSPKKPTERRRCGGSGRRGRCARLTRPEQAGKLITHAPSSLSHIAVAGTVCRMPAARGGIDGSAPIDALDARGLADAQGLARRRRWSAARRRAYRHRRDPLGQRVGVVAGRLDGHTLASGQRPRQADDDLDRLPLGNQRGQLGPGRCRRARAAVSSPGRRACRRGRSRQRRPVRCPHPHRSARRGSPPRAGDRSLDRGERRRAQRRRPSVPRPLGELRRPCRRRRRRRAAAPTRPARRRSVRGPGPPSSPPRPAGPCRRQRAAIATTPGRSTEPAANVDRQRAHVLGAGALRRLRRDDRDAADVLRARRQLRRRWPAPRRPCSRSSSRSASRSRVTCVDPLRHLLGRACALIADVTCSSSTRSRAR